MGVRAHQCGATARRRRWRRRRRAVCAVALLAGLCAGVALAMSSGANAQTSLLALMTMVPLRVIRPAVRSRLNLPRSLRMKAGVYGPHPSDALEFDQFSAGFPAKPTPSWNPSDALEFDQFAAGYPAKPTLSWNPSDALEFDQFAGGFPARPTPSWNPSDLLEYDQFKGSSPFGKPGR